MGFTSSLLKSPSPPLGIDRRLTGAEVSCYSPFQSPGNGRDSSLKPRVGVETMLRWLGDAEVALEWRNWQTHETQNLALGNQRGGSTPPSSTKILSPALAPGYAAAIAAENPAYGQPPAGSMTVYVIDATSTPARTGAILGSILNKAVLVYDQQLVSSHSLRPPPAVR